MRADEITDALRSRIRDGTYQPGSLLPSHRELQLSFSPKPSRTTITKAIAKLVDDGLILNTKERMGNLVADRVSTGAARQRIEGHLRPESTVNADPPRRIATPPEFANDLGETCIRRARQIYHEGTPLQISVSHVRVQVADVIEEIDTTPDLTPSWQRIYEERTNSQLQVLTWHGAKLSTEEEAAFFGLQSPHALPVSWNRYSTDDYLLGVSEVVFGPGTRLPVHQ